MQRGGQKKPRRGLLFIYNHVEVFVKNGPSQRKGKERETGFNLKKIA